MTEKFQSREERRKKQLAEKAKQKETKSKKGIWKKIFLVCMALGIVGMLSGVAVFAFLVKDAPKLDAAKLKDAIPSEIYDKDHNLITKVGSENRDYVEYEDIPKLVENAFLATEDVRFYEHNGVDLIRLGAAVIANIRDGYGSEGASTLTQQIVKNEFLTKEKKLKRKVQEAWLSYQLEQKYTKHEIFEMYVNKIWMSENSSGVKTAAKNYFGKELDELELHEAALLAGMPQSPENYNPFNYPDRAEKRRNIVLSLMHQHGFISKEKKEEAQKIPIESTLLSEEERQKKEQPYSSFVDVVIDEVQAKYGDDVNIFTDGLKVYTTLDSKAQTHVEKILNTNEYVKYPDEEFQAGITLLDTKTGEIRAIGGGRNQKVQRGFNFATDPRRQPGSTIKPLLDYGPAVEYLNWGTYHILEDKEYTYSDGTPVKNWDNKHLGSMTVREALARSRNIPAIQALQKVGLEKAQTFAEKLGLPFSENIFEPAAIGGLKDGFSSLQMAGAYSAFGNNGIYTEPHAVTEIELRDGTKIKMSPQSKIVMKDSTAFIITDMLKSVVNGSYGSGRAAAVPGVPIAGKTGTTNYSKEDVKKFNISSGVPDIWFAGYTTDYTAAIWTGYKERNKPIKYQDQGHAKTIFKSLMTYLSKEKKPADFKMPNTVKRVSIEKGTAKLAGEFTPSDQITYEYAVKGNEPKEVSNKFDKPEKPNNASVELNEDNKLLLKWDYPEEALEHVKFEVSISVNGNAEKLLTSTNKTSVEILHPLPGDTYAFKIVAIKGDAKSDPAQANITIPTSKDNEDDNGNGDDQGNGNGDGNGNNNDGQDDENDEDENDNGNNDDSGINPGDPQNNPGLPFLR